MKAPFTFAWELISPPIAREMLTHNPPKQNRNLRPKVVRAFATDMMSGNWSPSHQGIAFAVGGRLLDGQHRLSAIVQSGVSVPFLVCRDIPEKIDGSKATVMDTLDRGNARSIADVLKLSHGQVVNPLIVTAICAMIPRVFLFHSTGTQDSKRVAKITLHQTLSVLDLFKGSIKFLAENPPGVVALRSSPIGAACAIAHSVYREKVEEFYLAFASGEGLKAGSPVLALRNFCLNTPIGAMKERQSRINLSLRTLNALHAFITRAKDAGQMKGRIGVEGLEFFVGKQSGTAAEIERIFPSFAPTPKAAAKSKREEPRRTTPAAAGSNGSDKDWWKPDATTKRPLL